MAFKLPLPFNNLNARLKRRHSEEVTNILPSPKRTKTGETSSPRPEVQLQLHDASSSNHSHKRSPSKKTQAEKKSPRKPASPLTAPQGSLDANESGVLTGHLQDCLAYDLAVVFCGINPGRMSAETGHHYANPTNHFWRCLHRSGFTPTLIPPNEDCTLPQRFKIGLTNLVSRPSVSQADLTNQEMEQGSPVLFAKIVKYKPSWVAFVGKQIWTEFESWLATSCSTGKFIRSTDGSSSDGLHLARESAVSQSNGVDTLLTGTRDEEIPDAGDTLDQGHRLEQHDIFSTLPAKSLKRGSGPITPTRRRRAKPDTVHTRRRKKVGVEPFNWGVQPWRIRHDVPPSQGQGGHDHTYFFVSPSTSGRVVSHQLTDKIELFSQLRKVVCSEDLGLTVTQNGSPPGWEGKDVHIKSGITGQIVGAEN